MHLRVCLLLIVFFTVSSGASQLKFSQEEQAYLNNHKEILYCIDPDWMPFEKIENGQHIGMSSDYFRLFSELSGANFKLHVVPDWQHSMYAIKQGDCTVFSFLNFTQSRSEYLLFSDVILNSQNVIVARSNVKYLVDHTGLSGKTLGLVPDYAQDEYVKNYYPEINVVPIQNELDGLKRVTKGELDATSASIHLFSMYAEKYNFDDLKIVGYSRRNDELRVAVVKTEPILIDIFNKMIGAIEEQQHIEIFKKWNPVAYEEKPDATLAWQIATILLVLSIFLVERFVSSKRANHKLLKINEQLRTTQHQLEQQNIQLKYLSIHDGLTKVHNRKHIYDLMRKNTNLAKRHDKPLTMILIDLDDFKSINDALGHAEGDMVLERFGQILLASIRAGDAAGRWGGEEFIVLCQETTILGAHDMAERIRAAALDIQLKNNRRVTCSVGIAQLIFDETIEQWFERADKAMYQAKADGRNRIVIAP